MHSFSVNIRISQPSKVMFTSALPRWTSLFSGWQILMLTPKECISCILSPTGRIKDVLIGMRDVAHFIFFHEHTQTKPAVFKFCRLTLFSKNAPFQITKNGREIWIFFCSNFSFNILKYEYWSAIRADPLCQYFIIHTPWSIVIYHRQYM